MRLALGPHHVVGAAVLALAGCAGASIVGDPAASVIASGETVRVAGAGDAADDPAIWVAPDPADSLILGTDKTAGLYVFGLDGAVRQFLPEGRLNNVDLRAGFDAGGTDAVLVAATDRTDITLATYYLDPETGAVAPAPNGKIPLDVEDPYGACLGWGPDGALRATATGKEGTLREYRLSADAAGVHAEEIRRTDFGSIAEGCVYDDRTGELYVAQEDVAIWKLPADASDPDARTMVHPVDDAALVADIEGLALYPEGADGGYLVASSQGDSAYALFALPEGRYVGRIRVADGPSTDGTSGTDGIDATAQALPGFPAGLLVVQDDEDDAGGQNFKLIDWRAIAEALDLD